MRFKDYPIKILKPGTWLSDTISEDVEETLLRINQMIEEKTEDFYKTFIGQNNILQYLY